MYIPGCISSTADWNLRMPGESYESPVEWMGWPISMRTTDFRETDFGADAPSPCQITRGRGRENDKTFCVGLARAPITEASMSMLPSPYFITALTDSTTDRAGTSSREGIRKCTHSTPLGSNQQISKRRFNEASQNDIIK